MTSEALRDLVQGFEYGRGNADAAEGLLTDPGLEAPLALRSSDHDGLCSSSPRTKTMTESPTPRTPVWAPSSRGRADPTPGHQSLGVGG